MCVLLISYCSNDFDAPSERKFLNSWVMKTPGGGIQVQAVLIAASCSTQDTGCPEAQFF